MKLQQLRYIWEVAHHDLNVSATAQSLYTSQPGISKQIRLLEDELGVEVFTRSGKHLTSVTPAGESIIRLAGEILGQVANIKQIAQEFNQEDRGELRIASTYIQSRYILPDIVAQFRAAYPAVELSLFEGSLEQVEEKVLDGEVDFAISNEGMDPVNDLVRLPCFTWNRVLMVPRGHELTAMEDLSLEAIAKYPLVGFVFDATRGSDFEQAFKNKELEPNLAFTATDAHVIKNYVKLGLGIGIITSMPMDSFEDYDVELLPLGQLLPPCVTHICANRNIFLRSYMYDFIEIIAPHLSRRIVKHVFATTDKNEREDSLRQIDFQV